MLDSLALYAHFPWCVKKCPYCDFNSHPMPEQVDWRGYVDALLIDWNSQNQALQNQTLKEKSSKPVTSRSDIAIASIFLGGGTPSLFEAPHFARLLQSRYPWHMTPK